MKRFVLDFLRRGVISCGLGPLVLAILYLILQQCADLTTLTVDQVCIGIFSLSVLAFIAGGINTVYQIERLPLMAAISIHGGILYVCYLGAYLLNDWLESGMTPILVFTGIFVVGYLVIWAGIYTVTKKNTNKLNKALTKKRQSMESA